ncbi:tryptophan synthase subunit alpha [Falsibacillus albus]|uniref:Tryptophan synthase alpha chain n=1 Tax=Falsibacillus albus TaxID=2478915 RepID=A0A3L7JXA7_9BACI|nr:tryptophan synthase subunit alpha [Falsibacillus albus]RLQ95373.1 tryptophan synthase subunit alpha [Falsibacillus albus]
MSKVKLENAIHSKIEKGGKVFIPYIMAGDGGLRALEEQILFLQEAGVTAIELGIPFSDPVADGPTIQEAGKRALNEGTTLTGVLNELKSIKSSIEVPIILMTYVNPIFIYGIARFAADCKEAGVSGVIIPDVPVEEMEILSGSLKQAEIAIIQLATLTSPIERIKKISSLSEGFLYAVTVKGITGARAAFNVDVEEYLEEIKAISKVPVLAGFGISTSAHVESMASHCDGVIVGSKIIELLNNGEKDEIKELVAAVK